MTSCEDIAREMGTTRQNISQTVKISLRKIYKGLKRLNPDMTPLEIVQVIMKYFEIEDPDIPAFWSSFPLDIKKKVINSLN